jgi:hypothetical protein
MLSAQKFQVAEAAVPRDPISALGNIQKSAHLHGESAFSNGADITNSS